MKKNKNQNPAYVVVDENYDSFQLCHSIDEVSEHIEEVVEDNDDGYQEYLRVFELAREIPFQYIKKVVYED